MTTSDIKIGIVGAGENTRSRHIPGFQKISDVEIVGVVNRSRESSQRVANEFGIANTYAHWQEAIDDSATNAIMIGTWPYLHCPVTVAALEAGKHVLCEARMAMNAREAHKMFEASQKHPQLTAQIVPAPMSLHVDGTVQRLLREDYLGRVLVAEVRQSSGFLDANSPLHWRQNTDLNGLNIMSMGIWYEIVMRWLGHSVEVQAMGQTFIKTRNNENGNPRAARVPEHIDVLAKMECGAQLHLQISAACGLGQGNGVWLFGEAGTLYFDGKKLWGARRDESQLREIETPAEENSEWRVEAEFVNAIRGLEEVKLTDFRTGVKGMEFTEAVSRSVAEKRSVALPLRVL